METKYGERPPNTEPQKQQLIVIIRGRTQETDRHVEWIDAMSLVGWDSCLLEIPIRKCTATYE